MAPTNPTSVADSAGTKADHAPDAIIYIPHLGHKDSSARVIADRAAHALDLTRLIRPPHYEVVDAGSEKYPREDKTYETSVLTLRKESDGSTTDVADLYELDYRDNLTRRWKERSLLAKWALLAATILLALVPTLFVVLKKLVPRKLDYTTKHLRCQKKKDKEGKKNTCRCLVKKKLVFWGGAVQWRDVGQIFILLLIFGLLVGYLVVLTIAVVQMLSSGFPPEEPLTDAQVIALATTALGFVLPQGFSKDILTSAVVTTTLVQYLAFGARRRAINGQLTELVEHVLEKHPYDKVHILGYSFGSLIAIDALFPPHEEPTPGFAKVDTLVTLGCPVDIVRAFLPRYFVDRVCLKVKISGDEGDREEIVPRKWTNVYIPTDVLASNFRNDSLSLPAEFNVLGRLRSEEVKDDKRPSNEPYLLTPGSTHVQLRDYFGWLFLMGLNAHNLYWGDVASDSDSLLHVVKAMYGPDGVAKAA